MHCHHPQTDVSSRGSQFLLVFVSGCALLINYDQGHTFGLHMPTVGDALRPKSQFVNWF